MPSGRSGGAAGQAKPRCLPAATAPRWHCCGRQVADRSRFTAISTGIYGYPPALAAAIAVATVRQDLPCMGRSMSPSLASNSPTLALYQEELAP